MIRLAVRVRREQAELVLAELLELAPAGVEEVDAGEVVEYAVYGAAGELPALPALRAAAGAALVEVTTTEVADDWDERWKAFHEPVTVGRLHVRPPWTPPREGLLDVVIDPAQAFGTGAHPTTRLCLELLGELEPGGALLDLGCGSGVLAIAAARLGWGSVRGLDHDPESVRATLENAAANGVQVEACRHDLLRDGPAPVAPTVLANLLRPLLLRVADEGFAAPATGSAESRAHAKARAHAEARGAAESRGSVPDVLVASGLLAHEADEVAAAFAERLGLREAARREAGEWAALALRR